MTRRRLVDAGLAVVLTCSACHSHEADGEASKSPLAVSPADFRQLGWIEGRWVGHAPDGRPFYEEYRFTDDSTIGTWSYADSTAGTPVDSGAIRLRAGQVTSGNDMVAWVVTALDANRVAFAPQRGVRNSFSWERGAQGGWVARLHWTADGRQPAGDVVYHMEPRSR